MVSKPNELHFLIIIRKTVREYDLSSLNLKRFRGQVLTHAAIDQLIQKSCLSKLIRIKGIKVYTSRIKNFELLLTFKNNLTSREQAQTQITIHWLIITFKGQLLI